MFWNKYKRKSCTWTKLFWTPQKGLLADDRSFMGVFTPVICVSPIQSVFNYQEVAAVSGSSTMKPCHYVCCAVDIKVKKNYT